MNFNPETLGSAAVEIFITAIIFLLLGFGVGLLTKRKILLKQKESEFKKIIENERKAKQAAEDAITARDEFLAIAAHELKTPLTTIILRLQVTLDTILNQSLANFSGEQTVASLSIAQEQTRRLQSLIKDLLNFSLITTGKLDLELKKSNLEEIVKSTLERHEDHLKGGGNDINFKSDGVIEGYWDQIRLEQAISNLLTNAIK
jgi:signal transduction histidine kinase